MRHPRLLTHRAPTIALVGLMAFGLAGCSGASDSSTASSAGTARDMSAASPAAGTAMAPDVAEGPTGDTVKAGAPMMVRRADTALVVKDITGAAAEIRGIASAAGGSVLNEALSGEPATGDRSTVGTMTIQVPSEKLDDTLARLADLGDMVSRNTSADDVKATYVDTEARVKSMEASVDRMRTLMGQATAIGDIISIETELSRRQADLEALQAQLNSLKDQVAMAPISIRLTTDRVDLGVDGGGFLGGLKAGWTAFVASVNFLLMALGALLPFAVAAAVVLVPLVTWLRRRARAATSGPAAPTPATAAPASPAGAAPAARPAPVAHPAPSHPAPSQPEPSHPTPSSPPDAGDA